MTGHKINLKPRLWALLCFHSFMWQDGIREAWSRSLTAEGLVRRQQTLSKTLIDVPAPPICQDKFTQQHKKLSEPAPEPDVSGRIRFKGFERSSKYAVSSKRYERIFVYYQEITTTVDTRSTKRWRTNSAALRSVTFLGFSDFIVVVTQLHILFYKLYLLFMYFQIKSWTQ